MSRFGRFEVSGVLGRGAHGVVYSATSPDSSQEVAIKVLSAGRDANEVQRGRFQREVAALARLSHPGLMQVLDAGEAQGVPWFAMRKIEGESLEDRLREGPLSLPGVLDLARQLCEALEAAHAAGILHRDIKPDNVLWVAADGRYVLTDFGLAKDLEVLASIQLSREGAIQGTPGYWSPEQAAGRLDAVGPPTDVYSLGATLYRALTGRRPIEADDFVRMVLATQNAQPRPPRKLRPETPVWLERLLLRCLAKDPAQRFASVRELKQALLRADSGDAGGVRWTRRAALPLGAALLGLLGWLAWPPSAPRPPASAEGGADPSPSSTREPGGPWAPPRADQDALARWRQQLARDAAGPPGPRRAAWRTRLCAEGATRRDEALLDLRERLAALAELWPAEDFPPQDEAAQDLAGVVMARVRELEAAGARGLGGEPLGLLLALARAGLQTPVLPAYLLLAQLNDERLFLGEARSGLYQDYARYLAALTQVGVPEVSASYGRKARFAELDLERRWRSLTLYMARQRLQDATSDLRHQAEDPSLPPRLRAFLFRELSKGELPSLGQRGWRDSLRQLELAPEDPNALSFAIRWRLARTEREQPSAAELGQLEALIERSRLALAPLDDERLSILEEFFRDQLFYEETLRALRGQPSDLAAAAQRYGQTRDEPILRQGVEQRLREWTSARPWLRRAR